jgi:hypothetical protein
MRPLLLVAVIAGLVVMAFVHADDISGGIGTSAGMPAVATVDWTVSGGKVDGAKVTWTPHTSGDYVIEVSTGGSTGTIVETALAATTRTDHVPISPTIDARAVTAATVFVHER